MKRYDPDKPLISVHIPKCAGTSFSEVLKQWFGKGYLEHYHDEVRNRLPFRYNLFRDVYRKEYIPNLCIHGHFYNKRGNGLKDYYPGVDQIITILRDPFELHVSAYFYRKRREKENPGSVYWSGKQHPIIANNWSLEEYLDEWKHSYVLDFFPPKMNLENYKQVLDSRYLYVGVTEELQKSVDSLAELLGFGSVTVPNKNTSEREQDLPSEARETFARNNPLVTAVYEYALENYQLK